MTTNLYVTKSEIDLIKKAGIDIKVDWDQEYGDDDDEDIFYKIDINQKDKGHAQIIVCNDRDELRSKVILNKHEIDVVEEAGIEFKVDHNSWDESRPMQYDVYVSKKDASRIQPLLDKERENIAAKIKAEAASSS